MKKRKLSKPPKCGCGCGKRVKKARSGEWNEFILGHNPSNQRDNAGKWKPGESGNPEGCATGSRNRVTVEASNIFDGESGTIARKAVEMAQDGHPGMIKLILERVVPVCKSKPIKLPDMPKVESVADAATLTSYILEAVSNGTVSPVDGEVISRSCERHLRALQTCDLEVRLQTLEDSLQNR